MRLFLAIALPENITAELQAFVRSLQGLHADVRWSSPESWHVTLQFLGNAAATQYECLQNSLTNVRAAVAPVRLGALGFFDRVGIFHIAVEPASELVHLQQQVLQATTPCGFTPESRPWSPHITLARNRGRGHGIRELKSKVPAAPHISAFTAREFLLYESTLHPSGSRYEVRARFPFAA